ncbi:HAD family hydrolase [Marivita sp. GX14005]|uniref:HAD family hydrolase n=1 Tax=Marivita sp. GX14005 TaxID=2942276 RepID=UPI0032D57FC3
MSAGTAARPAAILFDKDGTLFDFRATWNAWAASLLTRLAGGDLARASMLGARIGFDVERAEFEPGSIAIAGTPLDVASALAPAIGGLSIRDLVDLLNADAAAAPMVEAVPLAELFDDLAAADLRLGVATNDGEAPTIAHLEKAGLRDRFDFIAGSDSGFGAKPGAGQLLAFCETVGVGPERAIMVGDSTHDLIAGRAAGMGVIAVLTGLASRSDLAPFADAVLPDIGHLPGWLGLTVNNR